MPRIINSRLVPYSAEEMFTLVNNVAAYPEFIPGCTDSQVIKSNKDEIIAKMRIAKSYIGKSFTTRNLLRRNKSITMFLIDGPFRAFAGCWRFTAINNKLSKVELYLDFEFKDRLFEVTFGLIFKEVVNSMIDAFERRAKDIYHV